MRLRKRLFIDHRVQGTLLLRVVAYWCCCVLAVGLSLLTWRLLTEPVQPAYQYFADAWHFALTAAIATALVLPLVIYDILTISNRFTGPLYRLRRELRRLAAGEPVPPVRFRNGDFWPELADEFNATAQRMEMLDKHGGKRPNDHRDKRTGGDERRSAGNAVEFRKAKRYDGRRQ